MRILPRTLLSILIVLSLLAISFPSVGAGKETVPPQGKGRKEKPTGTEIAAKAKKVKFKKDKAVTDSKGGKHLKFSPVDETSQEPGNLEDGKVVAQLDTDYDSADTGLPPGTYNLFLANVNGTWHLYAESGGQLVGQAAALNVKKLDAPPADTTPQIQHREASGAHAQLRSNAHRSPGIIQVVVNFFVETVLTPLEQEIVNNLQINWAVQTAMRFVGVDGAPGALPQSGG